MTKPPDDVLRCLTEKGRKMLRDDTQMSDETRLMIEIVNHIDAIDDENLELIYEEMVEAHGSAAAAVEDLKAGRVRLYWEED
ncbi:hypothetical protein [Bradyrhizobium sp.]|jgi:hypothetical protein|uniref:hypothetical protein n=1 Tax=Bradyrhizobium sp. TaxID=376 RepID=UPI003BB115D4